MGAKEKLKVGYVSTGYSPEAIPLVSTFMDLLQRVQVLKLLFARMKLLRKQIYSREKKSGSD